MNLVRLLLFAVALAAIGAVAAFAGRASGIDVEPGGSGMGHAEQGEAAPAVGLTDSVGGVRLEVAPVALEPGVTTRLRLALLADGEPLTDLDTHPDEPPLHLILVRRDLGDYRHVHPERDGTDWAVDVALPTAGVWRAYADFELDGEKIVLGRDLVVPGELAPSPRPAPSKEFSGGSYHVELEAGELRAGEEAPLAFAIERDGRAVESLQQYLGADGHLVAIREGDLAYSHVHPVESRPGSVAFDVELGDSGRYVLFFQFKHDGRVTTAPFTVDVR